MKGGASRPFLFVSFPAPCEGLGRLRAWQPRCARCGGEWNSPLPANAGDLIETPMKSPTADAASLATTGTVEKMMTLSAGEFANSLAAFAGPDLAIVDGRATFSLGELGFAGNDGSAEITYKPLPPRRVGGLLELPQARVTITLAGVLPADAQAFLRRFDIAFQRGGG